MLSQRPNCSGPSAATIPDSRGEIEVGSDFGEALWVDKKNIPKTWQELHEDTQRLLKIAEIA